jgi:hypothetical protein
MSRARSCYGLTVWLLAVALVGTVSCSRPASVAPDAGMTQTDQQQVPFHDGNQTDGSGLGLSSASWDNPAKTDNNLPFHDSQNLPAGTLLTVRLKSPIPAENPGTNSFAATVDEPVVIQGNTLIPRGAVVTGRVESVRTSNVKPDRGYVRLALQSVRVGGVDVPVQTASLFARQAPVQVSSLVRLEKGRRLTFRFIEPVSSPNGTALASH